MSFKKEFFSRSVIFFCCVLLIVFVNSGEAKIVQSVLKLFGLAKDETTTPPPPPPSNDEHLDNIYDDYGDYGDGFFPG